MINKDYCKRTTIVIFILLYMAILSSCVNTIEEDRIIEERFYSTTIKDSNGDSYEVFIYSDDTIINEDTWAGANEGDLVYTGYFEIIYRRLEGETLKRSPLGDNELEINMTRNTVYVIESKDDCYPDLLCIEIAEASNVMTIHSFYVDDGKIYAVEPIIGTYVVRDSSAEEMIVLKYIGFFAETERGYEWIEEHYSLDIDSRKLRLVYEECINTEDACRYLNASGNE